MITNGNYDTKLLADKTGRTKHACKHKLMTLLEKTGAGGPGGGIIANDPGVANGAGSSNSPPPYLAAMLANRHTSQAEQVYLLQTF